MVGVVVGVVVRVVVGMVVGVVVGMVLGAAAADGEVERERERERVSGAVLTRCSAAMAHGTHMRWKADQAICRGAIGGMPGPQVHLVDEDLMTNQNSLPCNKRAAK